MYIPCIIKYETVTNNLSLEKLKSQARKTKKYKKRRKVCVVEVNNIFPRIVWNYGWGIVNQTNGR